MLFYGKLRRRGNSYVVTIPKEIVEELHLAVGDLLAIQVQPVENQPIDPDTLRQIFEDSWKDNEAGYRYLAER